MWGKCHRFKPSAFHHFHHSVKPSAFPWGEFSQQSTRVKIGIGDFHQWQRSEVEEHYHILRVIIYNFWTGCTPEDDMINMRCLTLHMDLFLPFSCTVYGSLYMLVTKGWRHCRTFDAVMLFVCIYCNDLLLQYLFFWWRIMTWTDIALYSALSGSSQGIPKRRILGIITWFTLSWCRLLHSILPQVLTSIPFPVRQEKLSCRAAGQWMGKGSDWDFGAGQQELAELHYEPRQPNDAVGNELEQDPRVYCKCRVDIFV